MVSATLPDEELAIRAQRGDSAAMNYLIRKHSDSVHYKARSYFIPGASYEDTVQEGLIGLFKAIRDFRPNNDSSFRTFMELCVTRNIITAVKTATRQKHVPLNQAASLDKPIYHDDGTTEPTLLELIASPTQSDPEEALSSQELATDIRHLLRQRLSEFEAAVFVAYLKGRTYYEIADDLARPIKAVDNALQRVKKKIEENLAHLKVR